VCEQETGIPSYLTFTISSYRLSHLGVLKLLLSDLVDVLREVITIVESDCEVKTQK